MAAPPDRGTAAEPSDDELDHLAEVAVDAVSGKLAPAAVDDRTTRRVRAVVDAIRTAAGGR